VRVERVLQVKIPPGIEDGTSVRVTGEGGGGLRGGPPGNLYVLVRVAEHERFVRRDADLVCELPLTFAQLALGAEVEVPLLTGTAKLRVPPGTQPNEILRLRGKGMPRLHGRGHGDACFQVALQVPRKLTPSQREALEEFDRAMKDDGGWVKKMFGA
jgi:molecular chaperone DnaJ